MDVLNRPDLRPGTVADIPLPRDPSPPAADQDGPVIVCVDGSPNSVEALVWALQHASDEHRSVRVVTAWPLKPRAFVREVPGHFNEARWEAAEAQARAITQARSRVPSAPEVERDLVNATVLDAVLALSDPNTEVVLGTDRSDRTSLDPASLTGRAQQQASGPVILIPHCTD